jgi:hypothetical protein
VEAAHDRGNIQRDLKPGANVVLDGETALVESYDHGVYVFARSGTVWIQQRLLPESNQPARIQTALEGDTALVGVPGETVGANAIQGAVHVYNRSGGIWTWQATLLATPERAGQFFGFGLSFSGDTALVLGDHVYQFVRTGGTWVQQPSLALPPAPILTYRPTFVALDADTAIVRMNVDPRTPPVRTYIDGWRDVACAWIRRGHLATSSSRSTRSLAATRGRAVRARSSCSPCRTSQRAARRVHRRTSGPRSVATPLP